MSNTEWAIDRTILGEQGLDFDDDRYVRIVAGMGRLDDDAGSGKPQLICWSPGVFRSALETVREPGELGNYDAKWKQALEGTSARQVAILDQDCDSASPDLLSIASLFRHPAAGVEVAFVDKAAPDAELSFHWPLRIVAFPEDLPSLDLDTLRNLDPAKELTELQSVSRENPQSEILLLAKGIKVGLHRILGLPYQLHTSHIVVLGPTEIPWNELKEFVGASLTETHAMGLSFVSVGPDESVAEMINNWIKLLSQNAYWHQALTSFPPGKSLHVLDRSLLGRMNLASVARELGRRMSQHDAKVTAPDLDLQPIGLRFRGRRRSMARLGVQLEQTAGNISFSGGAGSLCTVVKLSRSEQQARRKAVPTGTPRTLQARVFTMVGGSRVLEEKYFVVGQKYKLSVWIGPQDSSALNAGPFNEEGLDWERQETWKLRLTFSEPNQWRQPLQGTLNLPRTGPSSTCDFIFAPTVPGPFCGRIIVSYRARILQTALLQARVLPETAVSLAGKPEQVHFRTETVVRRNLANLDERRSFDSCMMIARCQNGKVAAEVANKDGVYIADLHKLARSVEDISKVFANVARNSSAYEGDLSSAANRELLYELASTGATLYRHLVVEYTRKSSAAQALYKSDYLQIVSPQPDALVPIEFIYQYHPPASAKAPLCPNARKALREGSCPKTCVPTTNPAKHVCPLGLWGLRKVIERHTFRQELDKDLYIETDVAEPLRGRDQLNMHGPALFATSKKVKAKARSSLQRQIEKSWKEKGKVLTADSWDKWAEAVKKNSPVALLMLPHSFGTGSHIGLEISGDQREDNNLSIQHVVGPDGNHPLVFLLGCDVVRAADAEAYTNHVAFFRQHDAALVLGTLAPIWAEDAPKVARKLFPYLANLTNRSRARFGDMLRRAKCDAVSEGLMLALCLVAFGDADWYLTLGEG